MSLLDRWQVAQKAEKNHESHTGMPENTDWTERWLDEHFSLPLDHLYNKDILEIGCGTGMIHAFDFPCNNVGIDPLLLDFNEVLATSSARLVNGAGEALPFPESTFDVIICYNMLDHTKYPRKTVNESHRVLADDGELFLSINTFDAHWVLRRVADYIDRPHPHHFNISEVRSIFKRGGFSITSDSVRQMNIDGFKGQVAGSVFGLENYNAHMLP